MWQYPANWTVYSGTSPITPVVNNFASRQSQENNFKWKMYLINVYLFFCVTFQETRFKILIYIDYLKIWSQFLRWKILCADHLWFMQKMKYMPLWYHLLNKPHGTTSVSWLMAYITGLEGCKFWSICLHVKSENHKLILAVCGGRGRMKFHWQIVKRISNFSPKVFMLMEQIHRAWTQKDHR